MLQTHDFSLDVVRIIACAMVVMMHSPYPVTNADNGLFLVLVSYLCAPCIGLFFMTSGFIMLNGYVQESLFDIFVFLKRRIVRIGVPLVFWSVVGAALTGIDVDNAENGILWFLYCMAGLYLVTPILRRWIGGAKAREIEFYLGVWVLTLLIPVVRLFQPSACVDDTSFLYYFHGYVGYYVLGGYMSRFYGRDESILYRWRKWLVLPVLVLSVIFPIVVKVMGVNVDFYDLFWYLSISVALMCLAWWIVLKVACDRVNRFPKWITTLSSLTFGIYLVHILVMRNVLWQMEWMVRLNGCAQTFVCFVLTFVVSMALCWGLSNVRYVRMVIGM